MPEMIQGTAAWFEARCGKVTASRVADVIGRLKGGGWRAERARYRDQLVAERLTGQAASHFVTAEMVWGTDNEPRARAAYEFMFDASPAQVGFVDHPTIAMAGASPDGLVGEPGLVEFKCPKTTTHLGWLLAGTLPEERRPQILWQQACLPGRSWTDFVSYDPRLPADLQLFRVRVPRDDEAVAAIEREVVAFLAEVDAQVAQLMALCQRRVA